MQRSLTAWTHHTMMQIHNSRLSLVFHINHIVTFSIIYSSSLNYTRPVFVLILDSFLCLHPRFHVFYPPFLASFSSHSILFLAGALNHSISFAFFTHLPLVPPWLLSDLLFFFFTFVAYTVCAEEYRDI